MTSAEVGFLLTEDDASYTVCDGQGGGRIFRKPINPDDLRGCIAEYISECAEGLAEELVDELVGDEDDEEPTP